MAKLEKKGSVLESEMLDELIMSSNLKQNLGVSTQFNTTQPDYFDNFTRGESVNTPNIFKGNYFEKRMTEEIVL